MPARPAGATIPGGLARQQRDREKALRRIAKLRKKAADEIERLISFLDVSDPYASTELEESEGDLEEGGDEEPSLGSSDRNFDQDGTWAHWTGHRWDTDLERDVSDNEPSLGSVDGPDRGGQLRWAQGRGGDLEEQSDDEGVLVPASESATSKATSATSPTCRLLSTRCLRDSKQTDISIIRFFRAWP